jgi:hypothetical protein
MLKPKMVKELRRCVLEGAILRKSKIEQPPLIDDKEAKKTTKKKV